MKSRVIHQLARAVVVLVLIAMIYVPAVAHETSPDHSNDDHRGGAADRDGSNEDWSKYTIDDSITGATTHWILLSLGKEDKEFLLNFIDTLNVQDSKKEEWKSVLKEIWKKYPVNIQQGKNFLRITLGNGINKIELTAYEESILKDIDDEIGRLMGESLNSGITVTWVGPTHYTLLESACALNSGPLLEEYCTRQIFDKATEPDTWCAEDRICQMVNHGYVPYLHVGEAPSNIQKYATEAYSRINSGEYESGYENLAYASHFLEDLGNPLHTGAVPGQGIPELLGYRIHDAYENYVNDNWNTFKGDVEGATRTLWNSNPMQSGISLATDSSMNSEPLVWKIYRNFILNGGSFANIAADDGIRDITRTSLVETKQYVNGLVRYAANGARVFVITTDAGRHGSIDPSGAVRVLYKKDQTFTITPDTGYSISDVVVDNQFLGPMSSYTFTSVEDNHRIGAIFTRLVFYTIIPSAGPHGKITPSVPVRVLEGGTQTFTFTPDPGYVVEDVRIDGSSVGARSSYTFEDVQKNYRIRVTFRQTRTFTITPSAGPHGTITPSTAIIVPYGGSQTFTITPDSGYMIDQILVDGVPHAAEIPTYTFSEVTSDHTISASFREITFTITPSAGPSGTITPSTPVTVPYGGSQTFTITPDSGYVIGDVLVDGESRGAISTYTFSEVTSDHTISASFVVTFTITPSAGPGGTITPSEPVAVPYGGSQTFIITPDPGYEIDHIYVDDVNAGSSPTVTLAWITYDRTIRATFKAVESDPVFRNHCFLRDTSGSPNPIPEWIFNANPSRFFNWNYVSSDPHTHCNAYTWIGNSPETPANGIVTLYQEEVDLTGATGVRLHTEMWATGSASVTLDVDGMIDSELARNTGDAKYGGYGDYVFFPFSTPRTGVHTVGFTCRKDASDGYSAVTLADIHLIY